MRFTTVFATSLPLFAAKVFAQDASTTASTLDVTSVIANYYQTAPTLPPAISTSLAIALNSVETSFEANPTYASAHAALVSAAPDANAKSSLAKNGYNYHIVTTASWFHDKLPKAAESVVADKFATVLKVESEVFKNNSIAVPKAGGAGRVVGSEMKVLGAVVVGVLGAFVVL